METIASTPDPTEAAADLDSVADAQRAVRDRPWPLWLHPANAMLVGVFSLTPLLDEPARVIAFAATCLALLVLNFGAGHRIGTPFAIPTGAGFLAGLAVAAFFLAGAMLVNTFDGPAWGVVVCAAGASVSYAIGAIFHYRSTRR